MAAEDYFDTGNTSHTNLLPSDLQGRSELSRIASAAESDLISHFTRRKRSRTGMPRSGRLRDVVTGNENLSIGIEGDGYETDSTVVYLAHFEPKATNVGSSEDETNFKDAMAKAIADIILHRFQQEDSHGQHVAKARTGNRQMSYRRRHGQYIPDGALRRLKPYDVRPTPTVT